MTSLKLCLHVDQSELPNTTQKVNRPLCVCGTRFVTHKVTALVGRFISWYDAYIAHLITLMAAPTVKPVDKKKLKAYVLKWCESKILFGCALLQDLLKPSAILCKVLQDDALSVDDAVEAVRNTSKSIKKLRSTNFDELSTVKQVPPRIQSTEDGTTYQGAQLVKHDEGISYLKSHKRIRSRSLSWPPRHTPSLSTLGEHL